MHLKSQSAAYRAVHRPVRPPPIHRRRARFKANRFIVWNMYYDISGGLLVLAVTRDVCVCLCGCLCYRNTTTQRPTAVCGLNSFVPHARTQDGYLMLESRAARPSPRERRTKGMFFGIRARYAPAIKQIRTQMLTCCSKRDIRASRRAAIFGALWWRQ